VRILLDTRVYLWWIADSSELSARGSLITDGSNRPFLSTTSGWDITTGHGPGAIPSTYCG
jgi:PIN domain nuclease of toxin-antitoxin system